jgi:hypothetical protein
MYETTHSTITLMFRQIKRQRISRNLQKDWQMLLEPVFPIYPKPKTIHIERLALFIIRNAKRGHDILHSSALFLNTLQTR